MCVHILCDSCISVSVPVSVSVLETAFEFGWVRQLPEHPRFLFLQTHLCMCVHDVQAESLCVSMYVCNVCVMCTFMCVHEQV